MYSPWTLGALALVTVFIVRAAWNVHAKEVASAEALLRTNRELDKLAERHASLASAVSALGTSQGVETEIRQKFRVAKDGEEIAVILDDAATSTPVIAPVQHSFWYKLLHLFSSE